MLCSKIIIPVDINKRTKTVRGLKKTFTVVLQYAVGMN